MLELRSFYEELSSAHPGHARRLQELSAALEHPGATREKTLSTFSEHVGNGAHYARESLCAEADRHRRLAIERDELLREIRCLPGFEQFLLGKTICQLRASAWTSCHTERRGTPLRCVDCSCQRGSCSSRPASLSHFAAIRRSAEHAGEIAWPCSRYVL